MQTLTPVDSESFCRILCYYSNYTDNVQITRLANTKSFYLERVVFPGERFLFEAEANDLLEIYTSSPGNVVTDTVACDRLRVLEGFSVNT